MLIPNFSICPKKYKARQETIIDAYRKLFYHQIPKDKQYWTMCSYHTDDEGNFLKGSELGQILNSNLIELNQFYGVDIEKEIIDKNKLAKPDTNWINNDFFKAMKLSYKNKNFNPAIVNADLMYMNEKGSYKASEILSFIEDIGISDVMIICNIMMTNPHARERISDHDFDEDIKETIKLFESYTGFRYIWNTGKWNLYPECYVYNGTGKKSKTVMGTFIFYKKEN